MKLRKILALTLSVMIVLALSAGAWADNTVVGDYSPTAEQGTKTTVSGTNITLSKTVIFFNPQNMSIREPNLTYNYTISGATVANNTTVEDTNGDKATVNTGIMNYPDDTTRTTIAASATIAFNPSTSDTASSTGSPVVKTTTIAVTPTNYPHAGIYRYTITETNTDDAVAAAGITRASSENNEIRYLDVYIVNGTSGLTLAGAVIFKTNSNIQGKTKTVTSDKTVGFDAQDTSDYTNDTTVDKYYTYNLTVTKTTTGNMADKTHQFPIEVAMAKAAGLTNDATVDVSVKGGNTRTSSETVTLNDNATFQASLKDGGELYIKGIPYYPGTTPAYATISSVKEKNDTADAYTPSITTKTNLTDGTQSMEFSGGAIEANQERTTTGTEILQASYYSPVLGITNTMADVSPTGVALRFAPYLIMAGAAIALLVVMARRRKDTQDKSNSI